MTGNESETNSGAKVRAHCASALAAGHILARLNGDRRTKLLLDLASLLGRDHIRTALFAANREDMRDAIAARDRGELAASLVDRLHLGEAKLDGLAQGLRTLAEMKEMVGSVDLRRRLDEGLVLERRRCPVGLIGVVFEARPDALPQISGLCLKTGNAVVLKGGHEALRTNRALVSVIHAVLRDHHVPEAAVHLLEDREAFGHMLAQDDLVEAVIARGSGRFVAMVMENTKIPVLGHAEGLCHLYLHADAPAEMARRIAVDAKLGYPSACNAIETLLWHADALPAIRSCVDALVEGGAELRGCSATQTLGRGIIAASEDDWSTEWSGPTLSIRKVDDLDAALAHIARHGSRHTEAIVTRDERVAERFLDEVDAASVFWNASTRFADGYRYGLGAEVGISTGKLHARGPMGAQGLLTHRWVLKGAGQIASDYGQGPKQRQFAHLDLPTE